MSLISPKNFVAPLQNKVAIGAILVVAILVFVARLSGSALAPRGGGRAPSAAVSQPDDNPQDREVAQSIDNFLSSKRGKSGGARAPADPGDDGDFLQDLLKEEPAPAPVQKEESGPKGLNDIKKSLGLE